jgi:hypothetical protein
MINIIFCVPGSLFSGNFMDCWSNTIGYLLKHGINPILSRQQSSNIYIVRNKCLGANILRGVNQKPFQGEVTYDYIMWIDSDMVWRPEQIVQLVSHDKYIVSGVYSSDGGSFLCAVKDWNEEYCKKNGHFKFLDSSEFKDKKELIDVVYTGMGFMLVKKGVFESLEYPWFRPEQKTFGNISDVAMEDISFCLHIKEKGYQVLIDPQVRVGHEKKCIY